MQNTEIVKIEEAIVKMVVRMDGKDYEGDVKRAEIAYRLASTIEVLRRTATLEPVAALEKAASATAGGQ